VIDRWPVSIIETNASQLVLFDKSIHDFYRYFTPHYILLPNLLGLKVSVRQFLSFDIGLSIKIVSRIASKLIF
jgi:hypothetical protein